MTSIAMTCAAIIPATAQEGDLPPIGTSQSCEVDIPSDCVGAELDASGCMEFYRTRVTDLSDILRATLRSCPKEGVGEDLAVSERERLRSERDAAVEERNELQLRVDEQAAEIERLSDLARNRDAEITRPNDEGGSSQGEDLPPQTEAPDLAAAGGNEAAIDMDDDKNSVDDLPDAIDVCGTEVPSAEEMDSFIDENASLFSTLAPIQRDRLSRDLQAGLSSGDAVGAAWQSQIRFGAERQAASRAICRAFPYTCMGEKAYNLLCDE